MMHQEISNLLNKAEANLQLAEREQMRPNEDSVTFSICHAANHSIKDLLMAFLIYHHGAELNSLKSLEDFNKKYIDASVEQLISECQLIDDRFADIDLSVLNCSASNNNDHHLYCLSHEHVSKCAQLARNLQTLVLSYIDLNELLENSPAY